MVITEDGEHLHNGGTQPAERPSSPCRTDPPDHAFTGDVKVLQLKASAHAVVGPFDERGQDVKCCPAENKTAPKPSQAKNMRRPPSDLNHCGCVV
jgi:hypothetical protein